MTICSMLAAELWSCFPFCSIFSMLPHCKALVPYMHRLPCRLRAAAAVGISDVGAACRQPVLQWRHWVDLTCGTKQVRAGQFHICMAAHPMRTEVEQDAGKGARQSSGVDTVHHSMWTN